MGLDCQGVVKRKPVFGREPALTISHLEIAFMGLKGGADYERVEDETAEQWVQFVWMRDLDWENLVKHLSDPNIGTHFEESYFQADVDHSLKFNIMTKLMAPLRAWNGALNEGQGRRPRTWSDAH